MQGKKGKATMGNCTLQASAAPAPTGPSSPDRLAPGTVGLFQVDGFGGNEDLMGDMQDRSGPEGARNMRVWVSP